MTPEDPNSPINFFLMYNFTGDLMYTCRERKKRDDFAKLMHLHLNNCVHLIHVSFL